MSRQSRTVLFAGVAAVAVAFGVTAALPAMAQRGPARFTARLFDQADASRDGRVTWDEAWGLFQQRFNVADTNHDGGISLDEARGFRRAIALDAAAPANPPPPPPGRGPVEERQAAMLRALDANRDGKVSLDEVRPMAEAMFRALDRNGDGAITRDELPGHPPAPPAG